MELIVAPWGTRLARSGNDKVMDELPLRVLFVHDADVPLLGP